MATDTTVNNLVINKLTKAQYEAIASPSETELYLVPDEGDTIESISINGTEQTITNKNVDLPVPVSVDVDTIVKVTQAAYDALATKDSSTLYLITS